MASAADSHPIVKYNGILARRQAAKAALVARPQKYRRPRLHFSGHDDECCRPRMPKSLKRLMYEDIPLGTIHMKANSCHDGDLKFNGMSDSQIRCIAEYLVSISKADRNDIVAAMLTNCRPVFLGKIFDVYQKLAADAYWKNNYRILTGRTVVCDQSGVLH